MFLKRVRTQALSTALLGSIACAESTCASARTCAAIHQSNSDRKDISQSRIRYHRAIVNAPSSLPIAREGPRESRKILKNHVAQFFGIRTTTLQEACRLNQRNDAARQATPRKGIVFLLLWRDAQVGLPTSGRQTRAAPKPLYGGRTVAKKKKAAKKAGGAKKGAKKKKSTKKKSR